MSVELDDKTQQIFDQIKELTFLQTANLVKAFEDEFGISAAAAPVAVAAVAGGGGAAASSDEEKEYSVILKSAGASKINVLKEVRAVTGLGLKEAKELVDGAPKAIKEGLNANEAKEIKEKLEAAGATIDLE
ncbi:MAG: 50S ribosomal protein L7/L12 [Cyanobacteria bacterium HKST-UBA06]|nr:50S ribosomal protein L7/L12 [Cyanobacteria bacterium HKST-UBA04]MCA9807663.1 50S ribosomal protein L7/L12 [Cyanobacteria bacterium HKST-UBA06]MCA9842347.1 50S ribosomal protein L7/L12 [Cyanobacteria bacterium HKST-UBA03]